jgi:predicted MFS family arabinose efflux permease
MFGAVAGLRSVPFLYVVAGLAAGISAIDLPARASTVPNLVSRAKLPAALSLMFAQFQTTLIAGPAIGGIVIARFGLPLAYAIDVATFGASIAAVLAISPQPPKGRQPEPALRAIREGLAFALRQRPIAGGFFVDLCAMVLAMPRALFPAMAVGTFHAGATGLGLLYTAIGVGSVAGALLSGFVGRARRLGLGVVLSALAWGVCIALFGLSGGNLWVALVFLALGGAADAISAICRGTILQTTTPDRLRGRLSAANSMVVVGGPYLGDLRAGSMASLTSPAVSVEVGGLLCVLGCLAAFGLFPELISYDAKAAEAVEPVKGA